MADSQIQIHALSAERVADFLVFSDGEAFSDNFQWCFAIASASTRIARRSSGSPARRSKSGASAPASIVA